jgi:hypothetical protein
MGVGKEEQVDKLEHVYFAQFNSFYRDPYVCDFLGKNYTNCTPDMQVNNPYLFNVTLV